MTSSEHVWYVYPKDDHTNEVFSTILPTENFSAGLLCEDGKTRPLWRCEHQTVNRLKGSSTLRYDIFVREGGGEIRKWKFSKKKKKHKHKLVRASALASR